MRKIGLSAVNDDRYECFDMFGTLLVTGFLFLSGVVHDDRKENWYVWNPAGNGVPFFIIFTINIQAHEYCL
jgi:hypothetical protein